MHINKEGEAGLGRTGSERGGSPRGGGNTFVSGRLMARDPRLSYDADSSLVNDYDNSGSELARRWHSPVARERPFNHG